MSYTDNMPRKSRIDSPGALHHMERVAHTVPAGCFLLNDLSASGSNTMFLPIRL
jgi:hypothetical protein